MRRGRLPGVALVVALLAAAALTPAAVGAVFPVTTTADSGAGSLRQAVMDANGFAGSDVITFSIPGSGVHTITLTSGALPQLTQPVSIDGTTQPGYAGTPLI